MRYDEVYDIKMRMLIVKKKKLNRNAYNALRKVCYEKAAYILKLSQIKPSTFP